MASVRGGGGSPEWGIHLIGVGPILMLGSVTGIAEGFTAALVSYMYGFSPVCVTAGVSSDFPGVRHDFRHPQTRGYGVKGWLSDRRTWRLAEP